MHSVDSCSGTLNIKQGQESRETREIIHVPQPTNHPNDSSRWSKSRKLTSIISAVAWCFTSTMISGLSPAYILVKRTRQWHFHCRLEYRQWYSLRLFVDWDTVVTQSFALKYGRRVVVVGCTTWLLA
ncbi:hypothetical protein BDW66DRAFT_108594 [Aspergillus desertorum]